MDPDAAADVDAVASGKGGGRGAVGGKRIHGYSSKGGVQWEGGAVDGGSII